MTNKITSADIAKLIQGEKMKGKKTLKLKTSQVEFFKDKKPKIFLQTIGLKDVENYLTENNYTFEYEKTEKQVSVGYDMKGTIKKCSVRDLKTTNLVVKWS